MSQKLNFASNHSFVSEDSKKECDRKAKSDNNEFRMIWFQFYIGDYFRETQGLTHEQKGVYVDLICAYCNRQQPLPDDDTQLARLCSLSKKKWQKIRKSLERIFMVADGIWCLPRLDEQIARSIEKQAKNRESGRKGGKKSWELRQARAVANASNPLKQTLNKSQSHKHLPYGYKNEERSSDSGPTLAEAALRGDFDE